MTIEHEGATAGSDEDEGAVETAHGLPTWSDEDPSPAATVIPGPSAPSSAIGLCPFLATESGAWRAAFPVSEHRCTAVVPAVRIAPSKQRRLCLGPAHVGCATYAAALELRGTPAAGSGGAVAGFGTAEGLGTTEGRGTADGSSRGDRPAVVRHRPIPTTTPVLLERPRPALPVPATMQRGVGQLVLVALLAIAFIAIFFARLGSAPATTPSPSPSATAVTTASPSLTASPTPSLAGSPSPSASAVASPARTPRPSVRPSPSPSHPAAGGTYTVKSGDTLSGIAAKFGTTIKVLAQLNGLAPPYVIHPGQVLQIP